MNDVSMDALAGPAFTYALSDLPPHGPGMGRVLHGLAARSRLNFLRRVGQVGWEISSTSVLDTVAPLQAHVLREQAGRAAPASGALALYVHWSPGGGVSAMVLRQLALWREQGFTVVFVSNADVPPGDWDAVGEQASLRLQRRNVGYDFGAWRDAAARATARYGVPDELLLANDSVLGPILPLGPLVSAWRAGGDGLFGMTESWGGGPHLQSYALLARGAAVAEVLAHLAAIPDRRSKWRVVHAGEIGLSERVRLAGQRRAALFGYEAAVSRVDPATLAGFGPRFREPGAMRRFPLNPTHHLWRVLVERMGFPYLKRELVLRNPGRLPGVEHWPELVPSTLLRDIRDHLALMSG